MGHPRSEDPRDYILTVRLTASEKRRLDEKRGRMGLSKFVRRTLLRAEDLAEVDQDG